MNKYGRRTERKCKFCQHWLFSGNAYIEHRQVPYIIEYCSFMQSVRLVHPTLSMAREFSLEIDQFVASRIRASAEKN